jgi:hypothetical protein
MPAAYAEPPPDPAGGFPDNAGRIPSAGNGCKGSATLIRFNGARGSEFLAKCPRLVPVD